MQPLCDEPPPLFERGLWRIPLQPALPAWNRGELAGFGCDCDAWPSRGLRHPHSFSTIVVLRLTLPILLILSIRLPCIGKQGTSSDEMLCATCHLQEQLALIFKKDREIPYSSEFVDSQVRVPFTCSNLPTTETAASVARACSWLKPGCTVLYVSPRPCASVWARLTPVCLF